MVLPAKPPADDESLASFVRRRLGHEALERLAQPMVGGIYRRSRTVIACGDDAAFA